MTSSIFTSLTCYLLTSLVMNAGYVEDACAKMPEIFVATRTGHELTALR